MESDIKAKGLEFLYGQVSKGNIPQIKKGMLEDLLGFVEGLKAEEQARQMARRFEQISKEAGQDSSAEALAEKLTR